MVLVFSFLVITPEPALNPFNKNTTRYWLDFDNFHTDMHANGELPAIMTPLKTLGLFIVIIEIIRQGI